MSEARCKGCGDLILWVTMEKSGKPKPLNAVPTDRGTVQRFRGDDGRWYGRVLTPIERLPVGRLYVSHFATCPKADHFRRR